MALENGFLRKNNVPCSLGIIAAVRSVEHTKRIETTVHLLEHVYFIL